MDVVVGCCIVGMQASQDNHYFFDIILDGLQSYSETNALHSDITINNQVRGSDLRKWADSG